MIDIDFKDCHPSILEQLCKNFNIDCEYLSKYNLNPADIRDNIFKNDKCKVSALKTSILKVLNGRYVSKYQNNFFLKNYNRTEIYHDINCYKI